MISHAGVPMGEGLVDFVIITALREELDAILEKLPSPQ